MTRTELILLLTLIGTIAALAWANVNHGWDSLWPVGLWEPTLAERSAP